MQIGYELILLFCLTRYVLATLYEPRITHVESVHTLFQLYSLALLPYGNDATESESRQSGERAKVPLCRGRKLDLVQLVICTQEYAPYLLLPRTRNTREKFGVKPVLTGGTTAVPS